MPKLKLSLAVGLFALTLLGCGAATMNVSSHVQRNVDFTRYRTYDWGPADALPTGDPRLDRDPFFLDHVEGAVEKQMATHGYQRGDSNTLPDLLLHYHASVDHRLDLRVADQQNGTCEGEDCVFDYEAGTLVIDVVDTRTNTVVWRGWAQDSVDDVLGDHARMEHMINDAVRRMMERFPRTAALR